MAVDTRDKRASILGLGLALRLVLPNPGAIDQPDRQQLAYSYRGITTGTPVAQINQIIEATGEYVPAIEVSGEYVPAIAVSGSVE